MVNYRVVMVESCDHVGGAVNYKQQKCEELLEMINKVSQKKVFSTHYLQLQPKCMSNKKKRQEASISKILMTLETERAQLNELLKGTLGT